MTPKSAKRFSDQVMRQREAMTPTRRAAPAQSAKRFSDQVIRQREAMTPTRRAAPAKSAKRFSDQVMRQQDVMTPTPAHTAKRVGDKLRPPMGEA